MGFFSPFVLVFVVALYSSPQLVVPTNTNDIVPIIFAFGDSNTDSGNYMSAFGAIAGYPTGRFFPYQPSERASDGKLIIDFLCENVSANYLHAYLNSFEPDFGGGANFAFSGAAATYPPNELKVQVSQFNRFRNRSLELMSKGSMMKLVGEDGFKRALYLIDMGQNDLSKTAQEYSSYDEMVRRIPNVTFEIKQAVKDLYASGGRKFWVHNTGPLGCLPGLFKLVKFDKSTDLDPYGCIKFVNEAAQLFNRKLSELCEQLRKETNDATIVYTDIYSIKYDLIIKAGSYGFEDPLTPCFFNDTTYCDGSSKTISWEGWHYTHVANEFVASRVLSTKYSTPPLPFSFFLNASNM